MNLPSAWTKRFAVPAQVLASTLMLSACGSSMPERPLEARHIVQTEASMTADLNESIPSVVSSIMPLDMTGATAAFVDKFSVVVQNVDVQDILFALARDSDINIDISPDVAGTVSINAIDQTVFQILDRISRQASLRWRSTNDGLIIVENDTPFVRSYDIDYVNVTRDSTNEISVSTSIVSVGGGVGVGVTGVDR
jgi:general secretion pathway protein D